MKLHVQNWDLSTSNFLKIRYTDSLVCTGGLSCLVSFLYLYFFFSFFLFDWYNCVFYFLFFVVVVCFFFLLSYFLLVYLCFVYFLSFFYILVGIFVILFFLSFLMLVYLCLFKIKRSVPLLVIMTDDISLSHHYFRFVNVHQR